MLEFKKGFFLLRKNKWSVGPFKNISIQGVYELEKDFLMLNTKH